MRGRKRHISKEQLESLELALSIMKNSNTGGTRFKYKHLALILAHRKAEQNLIVAPESLEKKKVYSTSLNLIGFRVVKLISWIDPDLDVKTLNNYRSIDPLRHIPIHIKRRLAQLDKNQRRSINKDLYSNLPKDQDRANSIKGLRGRKPSTLRGILARKRSQRD